MEQVGEHTPACRLVGDMLQARRRKVTEKDVASVRGFATDFFRKVADAEVDRICGLVAKHGELSLVCRDDYRDDSPSRTIGVNLFLSSHGIIVSTVFDARKN